MSRNVDDLDRRIAAALQLNGRASWRDIAKALGASETTVARRARRLLDTGIVRVFVVPDPVAFELGTPTIIRLKCDVGAAADVARAVAQRPDARFVSLVTGTCDVVVELFVPSRRQLARVLFTEFSRIPGITETTSDTVLRTFKIAYDWSRDLLGDAAVAIEASVEVEPVGEPHSLDVIDLQMVHMLQADGRRTHAELAAGVGISESMARRRLGNLVQSGALRFATLVQPAFLGFEVEAVVWLWVRPSDLDQVADYLAKQRAVRYLSATSGYSDLMLEIFARSADDLYAFSTDILGGHTGIQRASISHELATLKRGHVMNLDLLDDDVEAGETSDRQL
jgi:DNA-binding Lrp family transcriptional regulator